MNTDGVSSPPASKGVWRVGDVIDDLYDVCEVIETGGMGVVHRVHHRGWNMDLAVKTPRPELVLSRRQITDFETEAETWVGLGLHPHVVACVYVRRMDGLPRVFAEWVEGGSLSEAIAGDGIESGRLYEGSHEEVLARILDLAIQFAWGLDYAHSRGLVHQDVKPANVMLTADGAAKVSDFGLAKARTAAGETTYGAAAHSVLAGFGGMTPAYCSPEQAQAAHTAQTGGRPAPLTRATDVWSWAISVWEMFTGAPPCRHGQAAAAAFATFREDNSVDDPAIPPMPGAITKLLARCLNPDPTTRPRRMGELADELTALYQELAGVPYPRTTPEASKLLADGLNNQALSMLDLGRVKEAEQLWQQAQAADPHHPHTVYNYGLHRWRRGELTDDVLVAELDVARTLHPDDPTCWRELAYVELERGEGEKAVAAIDAAPSREPDLAELAVIGRHHRTITHVIKGQRTALSDDGSVALTNFQSGSAAIWDAGTGRRIYQLDHGEWVPNISLSGDGRIAFTAASPSAGYAHSIGTDARVWDTASGTCIYVLPIKADADDPAVALSRNGRVALIGGGRNAGTADAWETTSGRHLRLLTGPPGFSSRVALSDNGRLALTGGVDGGAAAWDITTGRRLHVLSGALAMVTCVALSRDGRLSVLGGSFDRPAAELWDTFTGRLIHTLAGHTSGITCAVFSSDGRRALTVSADETGRLWDTATGQCVRTLIGHTGPIWSAALTSDGCIAVTGSRDNTVRIWDTTTGSCRRTLRSPANDVVSVSLSTTGDVLVAGSDAGEAAIWAFVTERRATPDAGGTVIRARRDETRPLWFGLRAPWSYSLPRASSELDTAARQVDAAVAAASRYLDAGSGSAAAEWLRSARSIPGYSRDPRLLGLWHRAGSYGRRLAITGVILRCTLPAPGVLSSDGGLCVTRNKDCTADLWDTRTRTRLHSFSGHQGPIYAAAFSHDGRRIVTASGDGTARIWDTPTGACQHVLSGHRDVVSHVSVSADGRLVLTGSTDHTARVWDNISGRCLHILSGHTAPIYCAVLSADGRIALTTAWSQERRAHNNTARVWDTATGNCLHSLINYQVSATLSSDGRRALIAIDDATWASVYDTATGECLHNLEGSQPTATALTHDGRLALVGNSDRVARIWDTVTGQLLHSLTGHTDVVTAATFSSDGGLAFTASLDKTVRIWDVKAGACLHTIAGQTGSVRSVGPSRDELCVLIMDRVWDIDWDYEFGASGSAGTTATPDRRE